MESIEKARLQQVLRDYKKLKNVCKFMTYRGEDILVDRCQYWDGADIDTGYAIMLRANHTYHYEISFWQAGDDGMEFLMKAVIRNRNICWYIENLFMSAQHLYIKEDDGRNVPWTYKDFKRWWIDHATNPIFFENIEITNEFIERGEEKYDL